MRRGDKAQAVWDSVSGTLLAQWRSLFGLLATPCSWLPNKPGLLCSKEVPTCRCGPACWPGCTQRLQYQRFAVLRFRDA